MRPYTPADDKRISAALRRGFRKGRPSPVEELPANVVNEVVRVMTQHNEVRPRPTPAELTAEDAAAREYLPTLPPPDDIA